VTTAKARPIGKPPPAKKARAVDVQPSNVLVEDTPIEVNREPNEDSCGPATPEPYDGTDVEELHDALPETRCSPAQLWQEISVVRSNPEFEHAVYANVADAHVENNWTGYCKPRGGVAYQIARAFQAMCTDGGSACSMNAIIEYAAGRHPLQLLSTEDRASFHEFFTELFGQAHDAQEKSERKLTSASSAELANLDALFFTPSGYSYLLFNKKAYNVRDHVAEIGHLISYPNSNPLWGAREDEDQEATTGASGSGHQPYWR
jgi:hypothetical protein